MDCRLEFKTADSLRTRCGRASYDKNESSVMDCRLDVRTADSLWSRVCPQVILFTTINSKTADPPRLDFYNIKR